MRREAPRHKGGRKTAAPLARKDVAKQLRPRGGNSTDTPKEKGKKEKRHHPQGERAESTTHEDERNGEETQLLLLVVLHSPLLLWTDSALSLFPCGWCCRSPFLLGAASSPSFCVMQHVLFLDKITELIEVTQVTCKKFPFVKGNAPLSIKAGRETAAPPERRRRTAAPPTRRRKQHQSKRGGDADLLLGGAADPSSSWVVQYALFGGASH